MRNFVYQGDEDSCGLAALKMLLLELTKKKGYRYLTADEENPLSLEDIRHMAFKEGVDIVWKRCQKKEDLYSSPRFPLLIVLNRYGKNHLVLLKKEKRGKFLVYDPDKGPKWILKQSVIEEFSGIYGEAHVFSEENCPYERPRIFNPWWFVVLFIVVALGICSLYFGLSFMGDENTYHLVFLFMSIYGLSMVGSRFFNEFLSKKFDKKWLKCVPSKTKKRLAKNYERYYTFKINTFPTFITLLESVSGVIGLSFLYGLNNLYFFVSEFGLALYSILESKIVRQGIAKEKESLVVEETNLLECKDTERGQLRKMKTIGEKANHIGVNAAYLRIVYFAAVAGLAFIPPIMNGNFTLNYYLFYLFGLLAVGQGVRILLSFFETKAERDKAYSYFLENFVKKEDSR